MSKIRALAALAGEFTDRIPQWDFPDNVALAESLCDFDLWEDT